MKNDFIVNNSVCVKMKQVLINQIESLLVDIGSLEWCCRISRAYAACKKKKIYKAKISHG